MRRVFRRLIRRINTTEWSVSWFEVLPGDDPSALADRLDPTIRASGPSGAKSDEPSEPPPDVEALE